MTYSYRPQGTCSKLMTFELEDGIIKKLEVIGGCNGNLQGMARLVEGLRAEDAIKKLRGIRCGFKPTSCPDQFAIALEQALAKNK